MPVGVPPVHPAPEPGPAPAPPMTAALNTVARRWPIVLAITAVMVVAAIVAGNVQTPTYTASSVISVGRVDVRVQTLPGYVAGAQALAAAYSRAMTTDVIVVPLARRLRMSPPAVRKRLVAVPIPEGTLVSIYGSGDSEAEAVDLTRAATAQFQQYVKTTDSGGRELAGLMARFRAQSRISAGYRRRIGELQDELNRAAAAAATSTASAKARRRARNRRMDKIERLQTLLDASELRKQTLTNQYNDRYGIITSTAGIQVVTSPVLAGTDRQRTVERLVVLGLIGGLLLGAAAALLFDRRRTRA